MNKHKFVLGKALILLLVRWSPTSPLRHVVGNHDADHLDEVWGEGYVGGCLRLIPSRGRAGVTVPTEQKHRPSKPALHTVGNPSIRETNP